MDGPLETPDWFKRGLRPSPGIIMLENNASLSEFYGCEDKVIAPWSVFRYNAF